MPENEVKVSLVADASGLVKEAGKASKAIEEARKAVIALNQALIGSAKFTQEEVQKLADAYAKIKAATDKKKALAEATKELGTTQRKMFRDMLQAGISIDELADATGKAKSEIIELAKIGYERFVKTASKMGMSAQEIADIYGKMEEEILKVISAGEQIPQATEKEIDHWASLKVAVSAYNEELERQAALRQRSKEWVTAIKKAQPSDMLFMPGGEQLSWLDAIEMGLGRTGKAADKAGKSWTGLLKKMFLWGIGAASAYRAYMTLRRAIEEGFKDVYENTEEYKKLADAIERTRNALVLSLTPADSVRSLMEDLAGWLNDTSDGFLSMSAAVEAWVYSFTSAEDVLLSFINLSQAIAERGGLQQLIGESVMYGAKGGEAFGEDVGARFAELEMQRLENAGKLNQYEKNYLEILKTKHGLLDQSMEDTSEYNSVINTLISSLENLAEAYDELNEEMAEVSAQADYDISYAYEVAARDIEDIWAEHAEEVEDIEKDYLDALDDLEKKANKQRLKQTKDNAREIEKAKEQHYMQMRHMQEQFNLSQIQNERIYEADRRWLVAEGDVLAIERLDERQELEQQAAEENFELQKRQQEEMFQLQLKYMEEAAHAQAEAMKQALAEERAAIEDERAERLAEAEEEARRAEEQRLKERDEEVREIAATEEEKLRELEAAYDDQIAAFAEMIGKIGAENELSKEETIKLAEAVWGKDAKFSQLVGESYDKTKYYMDLISGAVKDAMGDASEASEGYASTLDTYATPAMNRYATSTWNATAAQYALNAAQMAGVPQIGGSGAGWYGGSYYGSGTRREQFGGDSIVSSPTPFLAGEKGFPERVIVQPLSPIGIGGNLSVSWEGGAIPVEGHGSLSGIDLQMLGDNITVGMMNSLRVSLSRRYGVRGR